MMHRNRNVGSDRIGASGQYRRTHGISNIRHPLIAATARCHVTSPFPSRMRLWSTLYRLGMSPADAPTSRYEKREPFCSAIKRRTSSSDGAVRRNNASLTLSPTYVLRKQLEAGLSCCGQNSEPVRCERSAQDSGAGCIRQWRNSPTKFAFPRENSLPRSHAPASCSWNPDSICSRSQRM